eukprot:5227675-Pyramimonas_sp.AAC.1
MSLSSCLTITVVQPGTVGVRQLCDFQSWWYILASTYVPQLGPIAGHSSPPCTCRDKGVSEQVSGDFEFGSVGLLRSP